MIKKFQLKNKMNVLLVESKKAPVVSVQMWVRNGSADERKGEEGISHFIEHLVFKGTSRYKVGEIAKTVEGAGGELNAYTSFDQTVFYVTISSQFQDVGLDVISEMMLRPQFDPQEIENEKGVVIEEIKRSNDSPHRQASRLLFSGFYKKHPYGVPVIGYAENIQNVSAEEIVKYYEERYNSENMLLVVVGDFSTAEMKKKVVQKFDIPIKRKLRKVSRKVEPKKTRPHIKVQESQFKENFLYLVWPAPNGYAKDVLALDFLAMILGQGESSRLVKSIKLEKHLATSIGVSSYTPRDNGLFAISLTVKTENVAQALQEINNCLSEFLKSGPNPEELSKVRLNLESEKFYSLETVDGMANLYGHNEYFFSDYKMFSKQLSLMAQLTEKDILRVAKKYLVPEKLQAYGLVSSKKDSFEKELKSFLKNYSASFKQKNKSRKKVLRTKTKKAKKLNWSPQTSSGQVERFVLPNGVRVLIREIKETPVVQLKTALLGGVRYEDPKQSGINELLSRCFTAGTGAMSEADISEKLDGLASSISGFGGRNSVGLSMTSLSPFADEVFEVYHQVLRQPLFEASAVDREKGLMLEALKNRDDNPAQKCILNLNRELFGVHPYGRDPLGSSETLSAVTKKNIQQFHKAVINPKNMVVSVAGPIQSGQWRKKIESQFSSLEWSSQEFPPIELSKLTRQRSVFEEQNKEQAHIAVAYPGLTLFDKRRFALEVLQSVLSGQGGRLFIELRDKMSLAYSVAPLRLDGLDCGFFGAYIGCSPEKSKKSIEMMRAEFLKLQSDLIPRFELENAKRYLVGRYAIANQRTSQVVSLPLFDELYGGDYLEHLSYVKNIESVTAEEIQSLAQTIFSGPEVISHVGPKSSESLA